MRPNGIATIPEFKDLKVGDVLIWNGTKGFDWGGRFAVPGTTVRVYQKLSYCISVEDSAGTEQFFEAVEVPQCFVYPAAIVQAPLATPSVGMVTIESLKQGEKLRYIGPDFSTGWGTGTEVTIRAVTGRMIAVEAGGLTRGFYDDEIPILFERVSIQISITFSYDLSICEKCGAPNVYEAPANYPKTKPVTFRCGMCRAHYGA